MRKTLLAATCAALACANVALANPFGQMKGKIKEGLYETKMEMEMPGMPAGMGKQVMTFQNCVSDKDIEAGKFGKDDQMPKGCELKNFRMSGNTASYTMVCKGDMNMTVDNTVTFQDNGYRMNMKMAMTQDGQVMNMSQKMEARYVGPCKK